MFGVPHTFYTFVFFKSVGIGIVIGFLWFLFSLVRRTVFCGRIHAAAQDILFFISAAVITFLFLLDINAGILRFYIFAGEGIGFCLFFFLPARSFLQAFADAKERVQRVLSRRGFPLYRRFIKKRGKIKKNEKKLLQDL